MRAFGRTVGIGVWVLLCCFGFKCDEGSASCGDAETRVDGVCVPVEAEPPCKDGEEKVDGVCAPVETDGTDPACPGMCPTSVPVCDSERGECVECLEHSDCPGDANAQCKNGRCERCERNSHCTERDRSSCFEGLCVACASDRDCAHMEGAEICDAGVCVECTTAHDGACGGRSCNPKTNRCTGNAKFSRSVCGRCEASSECSISGNRCVGFANQLGGQTNYCLHTDRPGQYSANNQPWGCPRPFDGVTFPLRDVEGNSAQYCVFTADIYCEDFATLGDSCSSNGDCGVNLGACRSYRNRKVCTYSCNNAYQCPLGWNCGTDGYCQPL